MEPFQTTAIANVRAAAMDRLRAQLNEVTTPFLDESFIPSRWFRARDVAQWVRPACAVGPSLLKSPFLSAHVCAVHLPEKGVFGCIFAVDGGLLQSVVDDRLPQSADAAQNDSDVATMLLLEKAASQFLSVEKALDADFWPHLTGWLTETVTLSADAARAHDQLKAMLSGDAAVAASKDGVRFEVASACATEGGELAVRLVRGGILRAEDFLSSFGHDVLRCRAFRSWNVAICHGSFKKPSQIELQDEDVQEEEDDDDEADLPQIVLFVTGEGSARAIVAVQQLKRRNEDSDTVAHEEGFVAAIGLRIYCVPGVEYEACDDPRAFHCDAFELATVSPTAAETVHSEITLSDENVYMVLPTCDCGGDVGYVVRVWAEQPLTVQDVTRAEDLLEESFEEEEEEEEDEDEESNGHIPVG